MNKLITEMMLRAEPKLVEGLSRFFKTGRGEYGYGDKFLGIKVPVTREVVKECWRSVGFAEIEEALASEYHEIRLAALLVLIEIFSHAKKEKALQKSCVDLYLANTEHINNWEQDNGHHKNDNDGEDDCFNEFVLINLHIRHPHSFLF